MRCVIAFVLICSACHHGLDVPDVRDSRGRARRGPISSRPISRSKVIRVGLLAAGRHDHRTSHAGRILVLPSEMITSTPLGSVRSSRCLELGQPCSPCCSSSALVLSGIARAYGLDGMLIEQGGDLTVGQSNFDDHGKRRLDLNGLTMDSGRLRRGQP